MANFVFAYLSFHDNVLKFEKVTGNTELDALLAGLAKIGRPIEVPTAEDAKTLAFDCDMAIGATKVD